MIKTSINSLKRFISRVKQHIKQRTRPATLIITLAANELLLAYLCFACV